MDFALLPPEINSALMYAGPGAGPLLAAAASWNALGAQLEAAASGYATQVSGLTGWWLGPSSMLMAAAAAPYTAWLQVSAAQAEQTAAQAYAAAAAYEAAFAMTVPPPVIAANRAQLMVLIATNFFGQNTAAIAATEAEYMAMWTQDAAAMYAYAADSMTASTLESFEDPPRTTNENNESTQAAAVSRATADATSGRTQSLTQLSAPQQVQALSAAPVSVPPGGSLAVEPGSTITLSQGGTVILNSGTIIATTNGTQVGSQSSVIVNSGIFVTVTPSFNGTTFVPTGTTISAVNGPVTLTPAVSTGLSGYVGPASSVTITTPTTGTGVLGGASAWAQSGTATFIVGPGGATITNYAGVNATLTAVPLSPTPVAAAPVVSGSSGVAAAPLAGAPGLAGTSAIQPQLNPEGLMEWARSVSGADLAAGLGEAAG